MEKLRAAFDRLTLVQQTVLLVTILLISEFGFAFALGQQLRSAHEETETEARLSEVFIRTETMLISLVDYLRALEKYATTRNAPDLELSKQCENIISTNLQWLKGNLSNDQTLGPQTSQLLTKYEKFFRIVGVLETQIVTMPKERLLPFFGAVLERVNPLRQSLERDSVRLLHHEEKLLRALPEKQAVTREKVRMIILAGLVLNAVMMLWLTNFFVKRIGGRVSLLVDNTRRLGASKPMNEALPGNDELARLDNAMHEMADSISRAQRERQEFLAMVSHELRTPLTSIRGSAELMCLGVFGELPEPVAKGAEASMEELERLLSLINDLLDLEKMEAGKLTIVPKILALDEVLEAALFAVRKRADEKQIEIIVEESDAAIKADDARLRQAFTNLLQNAISYSPAGSKVKVRVEDENGAVKVNVIDEGHGVPPALQSCVLERFRRINDTDEGIVRGMGLPISRHLVKLHGGDISYKPGEQRGSVFTVLLPRVAE